MDKTNKAYQRLKAIPISPVLSIRNLSESVKEKAKATARYSLSKDPGQDRAQVLTRCLVATAAEQYVANWMGGWILGGDENHDDPYTYAADVVSAPEFYGIRIEVKTHQSDSRWISVTTGYGGDYPGGYGINLGPFLDYRIADLIVILNVEYDDDQGFWVVPKFVGDHSDTHKIVKKSNYEGWYLNV